MISTGFLVFTHPVSFVQRLSERLAYETHIMKASCEPKQITRCTRLCGLSASPQKLLMSGQNSLLEHAHLCIRRGTSSIWALSLANVLWTQIWDCNCQAVKPPRCPRARTNTRGKIPSQPRCQELYRHVWPAHHLRHALLDFRSR
jgi:hypothetical protein